MKLLNYGDHFYGYLNVWVGLSFIVHIAMNGFKCEYGTIPYANYMDVIPNDHISVF